MKSTNRSVQSPFLCFFFSLASPSPFFSCLLPFSSSTMPTSFHEVLAHGTTKLRVVYTNLSREVPFFLQQLKERWFDHAADHEKFLGLDLEYTADQRGVAVIQLCFARHVLIFQWAWSDKHCPELMDFLRSGITFASVDIRNDKLKMRHNFGIEIPAGCLVDLQTIFRLRHDRTSMAHMAVALIDNSFADMKTSFPKSQHKLWEKGPLDDINIEYAAKDAYVSYELYRKIRVVHYGQRHLEEGGHSDSDDSDE
uniref:3'-5' exonuclease domain-containing protein n=1 Tax=Hordeum vulgare subsp. vulgare TaxID=112509 RepID=A0A8I6YZU8_HORVV